MPRISASSANRSSVPTSPTSPTRTAWCRGVTQAAFLARWSAPRRSKTRAASAASRVFAVPDRRTAERARRCSGASPASPSSRRFGSAPARISTRTAPTRASEAATCRGASPVPRDRRFANRVRRARLKASSAARSVASMRANASVDSFLNVKAGSFDASRVTTSRETSSRAKPVASSSPPHRSRTPSRANHASSSASSTSARFASNATPARAAETTSGRARRSARHRTAAGVTPSLQTRTRVLFLKRETCSSKISPWSSPCSWTYARISATTAGRSRSHAACSTSRPRASSARTSAPRSSRNRNRHAHPLRAATCAGVSPSPFAARTTRNCSSPAQTDDACVFFFSDSPERRLSLSRTFPFTNDFFTNASRWSTLVIVRNA